MTDTAVRALITGGARGIGAATAELLAARGAKVALLDRDDSVRDTAAAIGATPLVADVTDSEAVDDAVDAAAAAIGGLSVVVNNAGVGDLRPLDAVDDRTWQRVLAVNLTGTFNVTRAAVPHLRTAGGGAIVNIASLSGRMPTRGEAAYSAAKAGVIALTASTALEYAPKIRCNCVAPGIVRTPLTAVFDDPEVFAPLAEALPLGRIGEADEIARVVAFLASEESSYLTGQTLTVDGGLSLAQAGTDVALRRLMGPSG